MKSRMYLTGLWARYNLSLLGKGIDRGEQRTNIDKTGLRDLYLQRGFFYFMIERGRASSILRENKKTWQIRQEYKKSIERKKNGNRPF
ncbi:hypothetical protein AAXB25_26310 [Paenibacillus lautus]|uniref:hypothetical protein n=1 Tax=Paenibacillus lautus TaxID=1401 RepID=UPI003D299513